MTTSKTSSRMPNKAGGDAPMRILGIDPGYDRLGIAVIERSSRGPGKETLLYSDCFQTSSKETIYARLTKVGEEIGRIIDTFEPNTVALETLFITKNQKTAMRVAEARGILIYEATKRGIPVYEYSPMQIKLAVTGDGTSDKARVIKMIRMLIAMPNKTSVSAIKPEKMVVLDDEYDAVAVALAHSALSNTRTISLS